MAQMIRAFLLAIATVVLFIPSSHKLNIPIVEVVNPGAQECARITKKKSVGIIGTNLTIESKIYDKAIHKIDNSIEIYSKACPLFVPLVEEGWWDNKITYMIVQEYLSTFKSKHIDTIVLGCTHYPLLKEPITHFLGEKISIVSSAMEVAKAVKSTLHNFELNNFKDNIGKLKFYTSDNIEKFTQFGSRILEQEIVNISHVDIESE